MLKQLYKMYSFKTIEHLDDVVINVIIPMFLLTLLRILLPSHIRLSSRSHAVRNGGALLAHTQKKTALIGFSLVPSIFPTEEYTTKSMQVAEMPVQSWLPCWQLKWQQQLIHNGEASLPPTLTVTLCQVTQMYPKCWLQCCACCQFPSRDRSAGLRE